MPKSDLKHAIGVTLRLAEDFMESLDTPKSLTVYLHIKYEMWDDLVSLKVDPKDYIDPSRFADDYQAVSYLSKFPYFKLKNDPKQVAIETFLNAEEQCRQTNRRFRLMRDCPNKFGSFVHDILHIAQRKVSKVLTPLDSFTLSKVIDSCGWGPGVSSSVKGSSTSVYNKFLGELEITPDLMAVGMHHVCNAYHPWPAVSLQAESEDGGFSAPTSMLPMAFKTIPGNTVTFVPKNAKTHRAIAVEPHVNTFFQKGIGGFIRKRLLKFGIDLNDQAPNQVGAREGSLTGLLATLDLSSASDTLSIELVRELLPDDWFFLLDSTRSKNGSLDGKHFRYHKFSSMGNGFTFELETLIFWSLCSAVMSYRGETGTCLVYGDDIVVPSTCFEDICNILEFAGFTVNPKKSFSTGSFRESCGQDFFGGVLVRPIFLKRVLRNVEDHYCVANSLRRYATNRGCIFEADSRFKRPWLTVFLSVPKSLRLRIPEGLGDVGFVSTFDEACPFTKKASDKYPQYEGYLVKALVSKASKRKATVASAWVQHWSMTSVEGVSNEGYYNLRGTNHYRTTTLLVREWSGTGAFN